MRTVEAVSDATLHAGIIRALQENPETSSAEILVHVENAVATLTGFVHNYFAKLAAEDAVKHVSGIEGLANDIQVTLGRNSSDPEIAREAVRALKDQPDVPHHGITVTVRDGLLTLEGSVETYRQKRSAEDAVITIHGAKGVISRLEIRG